MGKRKLQNYEGKSTKKHYGQDGMKVLRRGQKKRNQNRANLSLDRSKKGAVAEKRRSGSVGEKKAMRAK